MRKRHWAMCNWQWAFVAIRISMANRINRVHAQSEENPRSGQMSGMGRVRDNEGRGRINEGANRIDRFAAAVDVKSVTCSTLYAEIGGYILLVISSLGPHLTDLLQIPATMHCWAIE